MHKKIKEVTYFQGIDGLRGLSILLVVLYHYYPNLIPNGFIGVDIFFVISGFLITNILVLGTGDKNFTLRRFYIKRIKRIFPALILTLIFSVVMGWVFLLPNQYTALAYQVISGAGFFSNIYFLQQTDYFHPITTDTILLPLWSLSIEEQYYLFLPIIFIICYRFNIRYLYIFIAILLVSFFLNIVDISTFPMESFYSTTSRIWEILTGGIFALLNAMYKNDRSNCIKTPYLYILNKEFMGVVGFSCIFYAIFFNGKNNYPGWWALLPVLGATCILASLSSVVCKRILQNKILVFLGLISFPLYLSHWPILSFSYIYSFGTVGYITKIFLLVISIAVSFVIYKYVETPIRGHQKEKHNYEGSTIVALIFLLLLIVGFALVIIQNNGFTSRYSDYIGEISDFQRVNNLRYEWGDKTCFLNLPQQSYGDFKKCKSSHKDADKRRPTLFLWGDSHAAHLISGLKDRYGDKYNIVQRTATSCPPIFSSKNDSPCGLLNSHIIKEIDASRPQLIILAGRWKGSANLEVTKSIEMIKERASIYGGSIVMIAPPPQWDSSLPELIMRWGIQSSITEFSALPKRKKDNLSSYYPDINYEEFLRDLSKKNNIALVSLVDILCNSQGCLTLVGNTANDLVTYDQDHFTINASKYVVSKFNIP